MTLKIFVIGFLGIIIWGESKRYYLRNYGLEVPGRVQRVYKVGSKGQKNCKYYFNLNGKMIKNSVPDHDFHRGDSITILYCEKFPWINAAKKNIIK